MDFVRIIGCQEPFYTSQLLFVVHTKDTSKNRIFTDWEVRKVTFLLMFVCSGGVVASQHASLVTRQESSFGERVVCIWKVCTSGEGVGRHSPPSHTWGTTGYGKQAVGAHPTGMLSCILCCYSRSSCSFIFEFFLPETLAYVNVMRQKISMENPVAQTLTYAS